MLNFWERKKRDFPWRRTKNPYNLLVTEILLRRTTAQHVMKIYHKFFKKYKSFQDILETPESEIAKDLWRLGLSNQRSKQLKKLAEIIVHEHGGKIPTEESEILKLPGVGNYTCAALMCLAFEKPAAMVDSNFVRVVKRYFGGHYKNLDYNHKELWKFARSLVPEGKCKEFNLGLMDFTAIICVPKKPKCTKCNLAALCSYKKSNL